MKVTTQAIDPANNFTPFSLTIDFETEEEAMTFYTLFNTNCIVRSIPSLDASVIRKVIHNQNPDMSTRCYKTGNTTGALTTSIHKNC